VVVVLALASVGSSLPGRLGDQPFDEAARTLRNNCTTAQQVVSAASAAHPENDGSGQYIYDFGFLIETWSATDQEYHACFTRTDHDVQQSFEWTCTDERCGTRSGAGGEEPE
jgi:hypothetical protein